MEQPHHHDPQHRPASQQQQVLSLDTDMADMQPAGAGLPEDVSSCSNVGPPGTYYIQDVLAWRGYSLVDCGAEFRLFWLQSKLAEETEGEWRLDGGLEGPGHQHR